MTDKEKIRAEIERRINNLQKIGDEDELRLHYEEQYGVVQGYKSILSFIDSLPVKPKFKVGDVVRSSNGTILKIIGIGQYFYCCDNDYSFAFDIQDEFKLVERLVSEDLEKAAENFANEVEEKVATPQNPCFDEATLHHLRFGFVQGAKWQKEQDKETIELAEDHAMFAGIEKMREQMIKNSIEVKVRSDKDGLFTTETWDEMNGLLQKIGAKVGDKVYIRIIKQEKE